MLSPAILCYTLLQQFQIEEDYVFNPANIKLLRNRRTMSDKLENGMKLDLLLIMQGF